MQTHRSAHTQTHTHTPTQEYNRLTCYDWWLGRYPIFENPYPLTLHESPVTCCEYCADCTVDIIPALYSVGLRQKRQGYSKKVCLCLGVCVYGCGCERDRERDRERVSVCELGLND